MARLSDLDRPVGGSYISPEDLSHDGIIFEVYGASVRKSRFPNDDGTPKDEVVFQIRYDDDGAESEKLLTLTANDARLWFVDYFKDISAETIENLTLVKVKAAKGRAWVFKDADDE